jgi:hypothetical protein
VAELVLWPKRLWPNWYYGRNVLYPYEEIRELLPDFDWTNLPEEREVQNKKRDPNDCEIVFVYFPLFFSCCDFKISCSILVHIIKHNDSKNIEFHHK